MPHGGISRVHGLDALRLKASGSSALVYLHGAHVASFQSAEHGELLWLSEKAVYAEGKAIRGGIPLCFPWFGPHSARADLPAHGFARTSLFEFQGSQERGDTVIAEFSLQSSAHTAALFPQQFVARVRVTVGATLTVEFEVENTGADPFDYELALHSYLVVGDVREVSVSGLQGAAYFDKVSGQQASGQHSVAPAPAPLTLSGETDRVYDSTARVVVDDPRLQRQLIIDKSGSSSTVVWNPWQQKASKMADFTPETWPQMLCIETANVNPQGVHLLPQSRHRTTTVLSARHADLQMQIQL